MLRNSERVLSDAMITDIKSEMLDELDKSNDAKCVVVDYMMDAYLTDDWDSFRNFISNLIEHYEDEIMLTLNMELMEDSFNQTEDNDL